MQGNNNSIEKYIGDTWVFPLKFAQEDGTAIDITGLDFEVVVTDSDGVEILSKSSTVGDHADDDGANGLAYIVFESSETGIAKNRYRVSFKQTDDSYSPARITTVGSAPFFVRDAG